MPDIDLSYLVYDPAVGVSSTEDMTPDLLHKAVKNCLFTAFTWQPCYNSPVELSGGITCYVPILLPGAKVEVCCISPLVLCSFDIIDGEDSTVFQSVFTFSEPMASPGGYPPTVVLDAIADPFRQVILRCRDQVREFTCFYRILGGE